MEAAKLAAEKKVLELLKEQYKKAASDVAGKISIHDGRIKALLKDWDKLNGNEKTQLQSQIYQKKFQASLKKQIDDIIHELEKQQHKTISEYLGKCYENGFMGTMYDMHGQGVPLMVPIDQNAVAKAAVLESKVSRKLYGSYAKKLKTTIKKEISRGIASSLSYKDIARNLNSVAKVSYNNAARIARTEGHRIQVESAFDAQHAAKEAGADIVKQWDAALDSKTRENHGLLDGQIRELDEPFEVGGMRVMFPSSFGIAKEDINCRCALLQRAKWALGQSELETLKSRAEYFGLDKTDQFGKFKAAYLKAAKVNDTDKKAIFDYMGAKSYVVNDKLRRNIKLTPDETKFTIELDNALAKMPKYKGSLSRSLQFTSEDAVKDFLADYSIGGDVIYKEYLSTTKGEPYNPEGQVQIYIQDAASGCDISKFNSSENEVLYRRNQSFEVVNFKEVDGKYYILLVEKK